MDEANGCSLPCSTLAASLSSSSSVVPSECLNPNHVGPPFSQCSGLIDHERIHLPQILYSLGVLEEHSKAGSFAGRHHDRYRGRESQGAGASDGEHCYGVDDSMRYAWSRTE